MICGNGKWRGDSGNILDIDRIKGIEEEIGIRLRNGELRWFYRLEIDVLKE